MPYRQEENNSPIGRLLQDKKPDFSDKRIRISEDFPFYGVTKTKAGDAEISIALKIIKADGSQLIIQYHELISPMKFDGAGLIELNTISLSIKISGKNLHGLIDYLAEHRLVWIKEPDTDFVQVKEGEVEIDKDGIEVKEK